MDELQHIENMMMTLFLRNFCYLNFFLDGTANDSAAACNEHDTPILNNGTQDKGKF